MSFISAVKSGFVNYANFTGRATPSELWCWMLFTVVILIAFGVTDQLLYPGSKLGPFSFVDMLVIFGSIPPTLAVVVRRINDVGDNEPASQPAWRDDQARRAMGSTLGADGSSPIRCIATKAAAN
jgi:uncharacterized membrane protein YhaH (DUF805 family)